MNLRIRHRNTKPKERFPALCWSQSDEASGARRRALARRCPVSIHEILLCYLTSLQNIVVEQISEILEEVWIRNNLPTTTTK